MRKLKIFTDCSGVTSAYSIVDEKGNEYYYSDGFSTKEEVIEDVKDVYNMFKEVMGTIDEC